MKSDLRDDLRAPNIRSPFVICLARGGSKRISRKNLMEIGGRSLLQIAIETVHSCGWQIHISSDNLEILRESIRYQAATIYRSPQLADDESSSVDGILHAIDLLGIPNSQEVILVQCTSPFTNPHSLVTALAHVPCFSVVQDSHLLWSVTADGYPLFSQFWGVRSQELPKLFIPSGNFYITQAGWIRKYRSLFEPQSRPFEIPPEMALDIDDFEDLEYARWQAQRSIVPQSKPAKLHAIS